MENKIKRLWNNEEVLDFAADLDQLRAKHKDKINKLNTDSWMEEICKSLRELILREIQYDKTGNETILSLLNSVATSLDTAGFDYYVSLK